jgi:hypothetical protein
MIPLLIIYHTNSRSAGWRGLAAVLGPFGANCVQRLDVLLHALLLDPPLRLDVAVAVQLDKLVHERLGERDYRLSRGKKKLDTTQA